MAKVGSTVGDAVPFTTAADGDVVKTVSGLPAGGKVDQRHANYNRHMKIAAVFAVTAFVLGGVFAGLGFAKVGPFSRMPFAAKIASAALAGVGVITAIILVVLLKRQKEAQNERGSDYNAAVIIESTKGSSKTPPDSGLVEA